MCSVSRRLSRYLLVMVCALSVGAGLQAADEKASVVRDSHIEVDELRVRMMFCGESVETEGHVSDEFLRSGTIEKVELLPDCPTKQRWTVYLFNSVIKELNACVASRNTEGLSSCCCRLAQLLLHGQYDVAFFYGPWLTYLQVHLDKAPEWQEVVAKTETRFRKERR